MFGCLERREAFRCFFGGGRRKVVEGENFDFDTGTTSEKRNPGLPFLQESPLLGAEMLQERKRTCWHARQTTETYKTKTNEDSL